MTDPILDAWGPACTSSDMVRFGFWNGAVVTVHRDTIPAWEALDTVFRAFGYRVDQQFTGGYNCRRITGGAGMSRHSAGIAVDVNWNRNPYGAVLVTDMPAAMVRAGENIRTTGGAKVFRWGGRYKKNKDAMHWEINVTPAQLASGVTAPVVPQRDTSTMVEFPVLSLGMKGPAVADLQTLLKRTAKDVKVDGAFGPQTEAAVKGYQELKSVAVDGVVGAATWGELGDDAGFPVMRASK